MTGKATENSLMIVGQAFAISTNFSVSVGLAGWRRELSTSFKVSPKVFLS